MIKLTEAAKLLGIKPYLLRKLTRKHLVPFVFIGGSYWFDGDLLVKHFRSQMEANSMPQCQSADEKNT